jgi:Ran GTPase-activating protein (RanGAP) involved in mRNA processing and transport
MNVLIEDLVERLSVNDPCLQHVSLRRLPLASLSAFEVQAIVQALADNHVVDSLDLWFPNKCDEEDYNHDDDDDDDNDMDDTCYLYLIDTLSRNTSIRRLSVSSASDTAWTALFIGLSNNVSVQTLELGDAAAFEPDHVEWSSTTCRAAATMFQGNISVQELTMRGFSLLPNDNDNDSDNDNDNGGSNLNCAQLLAAGFAKNTTLQSVELHQIAGLANTQLLGMLNVPSIRIIECDLSMVVPPSPKQQEQDHQKQPYQPWTDLLSKTKKLQALRLIECRLTLEQIQDLSNGLGRDECNDNANDNHHCTLHVLDLRGNVLQEASCVALATALQYNTSLTKLILQDTDLTNAGLTRLSVGLGRNRSLIKLNLRGNQLQGELGCEALANALSPASSSSSSSSSSVASALKVLDMSENNLGNAGAAALGRLLSTNPTALQELHVESCDMTGSGVAALAQGLRQNTHLQELNMCQNVVDTKAAKVLASMLECNKTLITLNLSGCSVSDESAASLATALTHNETLQWLVLSFNRIGNVGVKALADMLPSTRLSALALQFNLFDNDGLEHFITGLAQNVNLKDLFVMNAQSYCNKTDACMREIVHYLSLNRAGRRCLQEAHPVKASIWPRILQRADNHYGANAIFHLLREQPDLVAEAAAN